MIHWNGFNRAGGVGCVWDDYYTREVEAVRVRAREGVDGGGDVTVKLFD